MTDYSEVIIDNCVPRTPAERCHRLYDWARGTERYTGEQIMRLFTLAEDAETITNGDPDPWENEDRMIEILREKVPEGYSIIVDTSDVLLLRTDDVYEGNV